MTRPHLKTELPQGRWPRFARIMTRIAFAFCVVVLMAWAFSLVFVAGYDSRYERDLYSVGSPGLFATVAIPAS